MGEPLALLEDLPRNNRDQLPSRSCRGAARGSRCIWRGGIVRRVRDWPHFSTFTAAVATRIRHEAEGGVSVGHIHDRPRHEKPGHDEERTR